MPLRAIAGAALRLALGVMLLAGGMTAVPGFAATPESAPAPAVAVPAQPPAAAAVSLDEYRARLATAARHVQTARNATQAQTRSEALAAAEAALAGLRAVQTALGSHTVDLQSLRGHISATAKALHADAGPARRAERLAALAALLQDYESAAAATGGHPSLADPALRKRLERALLGLNPPKTWRQRLTEWVQGWWDRLWRRAPAGGLPMDSDRAVGGAALAAGAVGLAIFAWGLVRSLKGYGLDDEARAGGGLKGESDRRTPSERWAAARALARSGDFRQALNLGHLALLMHFDDMGLVRFGQARTNREYFWQVRRVDRELAAGVGRLNALVEELLYSGRPAGPADFQQGADLVEDLWRRGEDASRRPGKTTGS